MKRIAPLLTLLVLAACSGGEGSFRVIANGEAAAESGYPLTVDGETFALEDDFTIAFEHVYVGLRGMTLESGDDVVRIDDPVVVDLHDGPTQIWDADVPAQRWNRVAYETKVPGHDDRIIGDVSFNAVHAMLTGNHAIYVIGTATQGGDTVRFAFGFPPKRQSRCENGDGTEGIVVTAGITEAEVTIHLDHLFFDSLAADEPAMRFEPFAAAALDGEVVNAYLSQPITDIRDRNGDPIMSGGNVVVYDPGPYALSPMDLEQYLRAAAGTMGHLNGEGHCEYDDVD